MEKKGDEKDDSSSPSKEWDWKELSRQFLAQAAEQQNRLWELESQAKNDAEYQAEYDHTLAAFSVYHHLWGKRFLFTREELISELEALFHAPMADKSPYNRQRFRMWWNAIIEELVNRHLHR